MLDTRSNLRHPVSLHPWTRLAVLVLMAGCIGGLVASFRPSQRDEGLGEIFYGTGGSFWTEEGLGDITDDTYLHYVWTTGPAILFGLMGLYFAAVDSQSRSLAPFINLRRGRPFNFSMALNLMDRATIPIMFKEWQSRSWSALANTITLSLSAFFTILSASLYRPGLVNSLDTVLLETETTFWVAAPAGEMAKPLGSTNSQIAVALILENNMTYPDFTYEDLAFPSFRLLSDISVPYADVYNDSDRSVLIETTVAALRSVLTCKVYNQSHMSFNQVNQMLTIEGEDCGLNDAPVLHQGLWIDSMHQNTTQLLGIAQDRPMMRNGVGTGCSDLLYVWGSYSNKLLNATAMGCNETFEALEVSTMFYPEPELRIRPDNPPTVQDDHRVSSMRLYDEGSTQNSTYQSLMEISQSEAKSVDPFFQLLTSSRYAIPEAMLRATKGTELQDVINAIKFQHRVIQAQVLNSERRHHVNVPEAHVVGDPLQTFPKANNSPSAGTYYGNRTEDRARKYLTQDAPATRTLEVLLGIAILLSSLSWVLMRHTDLLPRHPTSIASVAALLADGNLLEYLTDYKQHKDIILLANKFPPQTTFWLGTMQSRSESGVVVDRFGIYAIPPAAPVVKDEDQDVSAWRSNGESAAILMRDLGPA